MNSFENKVEIAMGYIDAIYRIEKMRADGIFGMYALEQQRIKKHEELCEIMMLGREQTVDICLFLDESIGFNLGELNSDYDYYREKYAKRLVRKLGMIQIINNTHSNKTTTTETEFVKTAYLTEVRRCKLEHQDL